MKTAMGLLIAHSNPESVLSAPGAVYISRARGGGGWSDDAGGNPRRRQSGVEEDHARDVLGHLEARARQHAEGDRAQGWQLL